MIANEQNHDDPSREPLAGRLLDWTLVIAMVAGIVAIAWAGHWMD